MKMKRMTRPITWNFSSIDFGGYHDDKTMREERSLSRHASHCAHFRRHAHGLRRRARVREFSALDRLYTTRDDESAPRLCHMADVCLTAPSVLSPISPNENRKRRHGYGDAGDGCGGTWFKRYRTGHSFARRLLHLRGFTVDVRQAEELVRFIEQLPQEMDKVRGRFSPSRAPPAFPPLLYRRAPFFFSFFLLRRQNSVPPPPLSVLVVVRVLGIVLVLARSSRETLAKR